MRPTWLDPDERLSRMEHNMLRFRALRLGSLPARPERLVVCGYGPSLVDHWREIRGPVMTCSGAHDFLILHGIVPDWHVEFDPREHKVGFVSHPLPKVTYFLASTCHPKMFAALRRNKVVMWHGFTDDDTARQVALVERIEGRDAHLLAGGTNAGMRALMVALEMGYRRFDLHGFDCCYRGAKQWAGKHYGKRHITSRVRVGGREFLTSDTMMQSTDDFFFIVLPRLLDANAISPFRFREIVQIRGDGLLATRFAIWRRDPALALSPEWFEPLDDTLRRAA